MGSDNLQELEQRVVALEAWKKEHLMDYEQHEKVEAERHDALVKAVTANTEAIGAFTQEMQGIIELYRDAVGVVRIGKGLQNFAIFITKWGALGTVSLFIAKWVKENLSMFI